MSTQESPEQLFPVSAEQLAALQTVTAGFTSRQLAWLSGYLWGRENASVQNESVQEVISPVLNTTESEAITLISASQTGNARRLCEELKTRFLSEKFAVNLVSAGEYKYKQLSREKIVIIVTSTQGDGAPPEEAVAFHKYLHSAKRPDLSGTSYAVFSLGDSSYEKFCQAGIDFDTQLAKAGATALLPRTDADLDYQSAAAVWTEALMRVLKERGITAGNPSPVTVQAGAATENHYSKTTPLTASFLVNQKITGRHSLKDVRHIEISAGDSGLRYQPGDSLGVWFENAPVLADEIITLLHSDAATEITVSGHTYPLREALIRHLELTQNNGGTVSRYAQLSQHETLSALISDKQAALHYAQTTPVAEMLRQAPCRPSAQAFADILRPLTPRLYSISSSQAEAEDEVHLTVGVVRYDTNGRMRTGGATGFLADRIQEGGDVRIFIERNDNFRLPADPDVPVIMIGAGTGIAPFRAFMQQRENDGASGKNWLFYGNQRFTEDFLYQTEWQRYVREGVLTNISLAWSRDKPVRTYVQDKLREQGAEVWRWIESGAHIYICGNAGLMARDTEDALLEIISRYGNRDGESADEFLSELRTARRYQRDVY